MWATEFANLFLSHLWQLTALLVLVSLADGLLARRWPQLLACLWLAVLIKALVPPIWASRFGLFSWTETGWFPLSASTSFVPQLGADPAMSMVVYAGIACWFAGCLVSVWVITYRWVRLWRQIREEGSQLDEALTQRAAELAEEIGLSKCPQIIVCENQGPFVIGFFRTTLCLPRDLIESNDWATLKPILLHELVHLRRRDTLASQIQLVATCVWWFHPLIRWASRRLTQAVEYSVDHEVTLNRGCSPRVYAQALLRVIELKGNAAPAIGVGVSPTWITKLRIQQILRYSGQSQSGSKKWALPLLFAGILVVVLPGKPLSLFVPTCTPGIISDLESSSSLGQSPMVIKSE